MISLNIPINVLLIGFNRSDMVKASIQRLQNIGDINIWVAIDSPRPNNYRDHNENLKIKSILSQSSISSDQILFRDKNQGCREGVMSAISWFFDFNECGIILEDDVQVDEGYLRCMQILLKRYQKTRSIFSISSHSSLNYENLSSMCNAFYISPLCRIWGWATWRKQWLEHMALIKRTNDYSLLDLYYLIPHPYRSFDAAMRLYQCKKGIFDTWDYEWNLTHLVMKGSSLTPYSNYCLNHGFGEHATHTFDCSNSPSLNLTHFDVRCLNNPIFIDLFPADQLKLLSHECGFSNSSSDFHDRLRLLKQIAKNFFSKS